MDLDGAKNSSFIPKLPPSHPKSPAHTKCHRLLNSIKSSRRIWQPLPIWEFHGGNGVSASINFREVHLARLDLALARSRRWTRWWWWWRSVNKRRKQTKPLRWKQKVWKKVEKAKMRLRLIFCTKRISPGKIANSIFQRNSKLHSIHHLCRRFSIP